MKAMLSLLAVIAAALVMLAMPPRPGVARTAPRPSQCGPIADSIERSLIEMAELAHAVARGEVTPEQARPRLAALRNTVAQGHQMFTINACFGAPAPAALWVPAGTGDCSGTDVGRSEGHVPEPALCAGAARTAVCWDGDVRRNGPAGRAWCTYKSVTAAQCRGGGAPGIVYSCGG